MKIFFRLIILISTYLFIKSCIPAFHESEKSFSKSGPVNRLFINPKRPYEGFYEKRRMKERGFVSEEDILFPVLKIFQTDEKTNNTYSYFVKINQRDRNDLKSMITPASSKKNVKKYPVQVYQVLETYANNPFKFRYMYFFEEIMNEKEEISNEKLNEIKEIINKSYEEEKNKSYEKEEKKIVKMEFLFISKWIFDWKIYVIRLFFENNKEESFAIVDSKNNNNKMEITHCLGSDRMEINLEYLD